MDFDLDKHIDAIADVERGVDSRFQEVVEAPMYTTEADVLRGNATSSIENIISAFGFEYIPQSNNQAELLSVIASDSTYEDVLRIHFSENLLNDRITIERFGDKINVIDELSSSQYQVQDENIINLAKWEGGFSNLDNSRMEILESYDYEKTLKLYENHLSYKVAKGAIYGVDLVSADELENFKTIRDSNDSEALNNIVNAEGGVENMILKSAKNKYEVFDHYENNRMIGVQNSLEYGKSNLEIIDMVASGEYQQDDRMLQMQFGYNQAFSADTDMRKMSYIMGEISIDELHTSLNKSVKDRNMMIQELGGVSGVIRDYGYAKEDFKDFVRDNPELIEAIKKDGADYDPKSLQYELSAHAPSLDISSGDEVMGEFDLDQLTVGLIRNDPSSTHAIFDHNGNVKLNYLSQDYVDDYVIGNYASDYQKTPFKIGNNDSVDGFEYSSQITKSIESSVKPAAPLYKTKARLKM